jgi:hypothetical protein
MDCPIFGGNLFKGSFFRLQAVCVKALEQWLQEDDRKSRPFRAERVREVNELFPIPEGGLTTSAVRRRCPLWSKRA